MKAFKSQVSVGLGATTFADVHIMRISQNSSALCGVRCVISRCEQRSMIAEARAKPGALVAHRMQLIEVRLASASASFELNGKAILAGVRCVSATDQMQIFPMPRFRQTCGSKCKSPRGGDPPSATY
jgi:hypothetical protein